MPHNCPPCFTTLPNPDHAFSYPPEHSLSTVSTPMAHQSHLSLSHPDLFQRLLRPHPIHANSNINSFVTAITNHIIEHAKQKLGQYCCHPHRQSIPWWTPELITLSRTRKRSLRLFQRRCNPPTRHKYQRQNQIFNAAMTTAKTRYIYKKTHSASHSHPNFWKSIKIIAMTTRHETYHLKQTNTTPLSPTTNTLLNVY